MKNYDELYNKILGRLNSRRIESTNEVVSAAEVRNAIYEIMGLYNVILVSSTQTTIKKINKANGYRKLSLSKKRFPRIQDMTNIIDENANAYIYITLEDGNKIVLTGNGETVSVYRTTLNSNETIDFVNKNKEIFNIYLGSLKDFANNFPGIKMNFGQNVKNVYDQKIDDGFMCCNIKVTAPEESQMLFSSLEDHNLSTDKTKKYGELFDYVAFYNDELFHKTAINMNDLNPFVKMCVQKHMQLQDTSFTLSK